MTYSQLFADRWAAVKRLKIEIKQVPDEAEQLFNLVAALRPARMLEIGSYFGGTAYLYAAACAPGATIVCVDYGHKAKDLEAVIALLRTEGYNAILVKGNSHDPSIVKGAWGALGCVQAGFVHIDGDHSARGVIADFQDYGVMVAAEGFIAFHDIKRSVGGCQVKEAWPKIRETARTWREIVGTPWADGNPCGIGVLWP